MPKNRCRGDGWLWGFDPVVPFGFSRGRVGLEGYLVLAIWQSSGRWSSRCCAAPGHVGRSPPVGRPARRRTLQQPVNNPAGSPLRAA